MADPRVAIAYDCLFPIDTGGRERVYRRIAELLANRGSAVDYVTRSGRGSGAGTSFEVVGVWSGEVADASGARTTSSVIAFAAALFGHFVRHRCAPTTSSSRHCRCSTCSRYGWRCSAREPSSLPTGSRSGRGASGVRTRARSSAPSRSCCRRGACTWVAFRRSTAPSPAIGSCGTGAASIPSCSGSSTSSARRRMLRPRPPRPRSRSSWGGTSPTSASTHCPRPSPRRARVPDLAAVVAGSGLETDAARRGVDAAGVAEVVRFASRVFEEKLDGSSPPLPCS